MEVYKCKTCGHLEFESAPDKCLVCQATGSFVEDSEALKSPVDPNNLTDAEKKHIPQIVVVKECGLIPGGCCTDVHVRVGEIEHVMTEEHYIRYVDYYVDNKFISRVWLSPELCHSACALHLNIKEGTKVRVVENCNMHGSWMAEVQV